MLLDPGNSQSRRIPLTRMIQLQANDLTCETGLTLTQWHSPYCNIPCITRMALSPEKVSNQQEVVSAKADSEIIIAFFAAVPAPAIQLASC